MGKFAKIAVVAIYVLQIAVLFKEQIKHLYESALHAAGRNTVVVDGSRHGGLFRGTLDRFKVRRQHRKAERPDRIASASSMPAAILVMAEKHDEGPHPHHDDDKKARLRGSTRRTGVILFANLFRAIRKIRPTDEALLTHAPSPFRLLRYAA